MDKGFKPLWDLIERRRLVSVEPGSASVQRSSTRTSECVSKELVVSDPVWIRVDGRRVDGHIAEKARTHCVVVVEDGKSYKAPWSLVFARSDAERKHVTTGVEEAKARFRAGDQVEFLAKGTILQGKIVRMNPRRAVVVCDKYGEWQVPYKILFRISPEREDEPSEVLKAVASRAQRLISQHGLDGWSFQYDDASRRAGACKYDTKVISMARQYCLAASEEERTDTILHEIAHALVGRGHHHDDVWKRKAREIGCTTERCHRVDFARPKYIVSCPQCKWVVKREKQRRGLVCRRCKSKLVFQTFSDELWEKAQKIAGAVADDAKPRRTDAGHGRRKQMTLDELSKLIPEEKRKLFKSLTLDEKRKLLKSYLPRRTFRYLSEAAETGLAIDTLHALENADPYSPNAKHINRARVFSKLFTEDEMKQWFRESDWYRDFIARHPVTEDAATRTSKLSKTKTLDVLVGIGIFAALIAFIVIAFFLTA